MKIRSKYKFLIIVIVTAFLILLSNFSYASMDYKVDNISAIVTNTKVQVEWSNTKDADGYEIYVDIPSIGYRYLGETSYNKVQIIGFTQGEDYAIKVRAYEIENNKKTYSDFSSEIKFKFGETSNITSDIETIKNVKAISLGTTGSLEWDKIENADGYEVYASLENSDFVNLGTTNATKVTLIGMQEENIYMIKVRPFAENEGEKVYGSFSNTAILKYEKNEEIEETTTKPDKVKNLQINMQEDVANLTWNNITDADGYEISIEIPGYSDAKYYTSDNKITLRGFTEGYTYNVKVSAYKYKNGEKIFGDCSNIGKIKYEKVVEKPATVTGLNVTMNGSAATFRWNSVSKADGYEMVVYIPGYGETTHNITGTSTTMTGFTEKNYNYTVKVRAYKNDNGKKVYGEYSNLVYFKNQEKEVVEKPATVTGLNVTMNGSAATFRWNSVSEADGYEMVVYIPGYGETKHTITGTSKTMTGFTEKNYNYTVKVRAYKNNNGEKLCGEYSNLVYFRNQEKEEIVEKPATVTGLNVTMNGSAATFRWNSVSGADGYEMVIYIPGYGETKHNVTGTSTTMTGFTEKNYNYTVKVRAYKYTNGEKLYGEYSNTVYFRNQEKEEEETTIGKVKGLTVNRNGSAATFKWNSVSGADGYEIVVNIPGIGNCTYTETATSRYMTGFTNTSYKYTIKVRAYTIENGRKVYGDYSDTVKF